MMTYNIRFLWFLPDILHPLNQLVRKDTKWVWRKSYDKAFQEAKKLVSTAPVLAHYDADKPVKLYCDASPWGVGACLMHIVDGQEKTVAYVSRTLTLAEGNYAQIEREALTIIFAVRKFHQYLYGRQFTWVTDHWPPCRISGHDQGIPTSRMQRWALISSTYQYKLEFTPGTQNQCADCMSRLPFCSSCRDNAEQSGCVLLMDTSALPVTAY